MENIIGEITTSPIQSHNVILFLKFFGGNELIFIAVDFLQI